MNKLSKVLLVVIIILIIALAVMTYGYLKQRKSAKENLNLYLETKAELLKMEHPEATIDYPN